MESQQLLKKSPVLHLNTIDGKRVLTVQNPIQKVKLSIQPAENTIQSASPLSFNPMPHNCFDRLPL